MATENANGEDDARMQIQDILEGLASKFIMLLLQLVSVHDLMLILNVTVDEAKLAEPGNDELDQKIDLLDRIFTECKLLSACKQTNKLRKYGNMCFYFSLDVEVGEQNGGGGGGNEKSVDVSQARLDIQAFSKLAAINHQRIRRVAASNFTFRAADFANRIVSNRTWTYECS